MKWILLIEEPLSSALQSFVYFKGCRFAGTLFSSVSQTLNPPLASANLTLTMLQDG